MQFNTLDWQVDNGILTLTLNRPDKLNAFTVEMANELIAAFNAASEDDSVKVVVVTGAGKAFCAGMDLSVDGNVFGLDENLEPSLNDLHENYERDDIVNGVRDTGGRVTLAIYDCKKPVIAAINGAAVGIGATMTLAMDIRLVSEKARIGFVFKKLGIVPEACSSWFLPRIVGIQQALEWTYSGDIFKAEEAVAGRLAKGPYAPEQLLDEAYKLAAKIAEASPVSTAFIRQMMYRNAAQDHPREAHRIDSLAMYYTSVGDGKEGVAAFLEKRPADFKAKASEMPDFYPWWEE
jgi:enoyl-CoA hydratase/carnithine racemase